MLTNPTPERRAALAQRTAHPVMYLLAQNIKSLPKVPLCESQGRFGNVFLT
jgi:hypothetical protein